MKKKEVIAMVGKKNIGSWWTLERIIAIGGWGLLAASIYGYSVDFRFASLGFMFGAVLGFLFTLYSLDGPKVFETHLKVKKIRDKNLIDVLGNDGKTHTLRCGQVNFSKQDVKDSFLKVSYRINDPTIELVVGQNLNQIWKE